MANNSVKRLIEPSERLGYSEGSIVNFANL